MSNGDKDLQKIKELIEVMKQNGLVELQIEHGDDKISLKRAQPQSLPVAVPVAVSHAPLQNGPEAVAQPQNDSSTAGVEEDLIDIKSPLVGTCYFAASPDSDDFVEVGSQVNEQTVVCIIEAMKVMNEIKADTHGTIVEIVADNGQAVEYGQVLFRVRPD